MNDDDEMAYPRWADRHCTFDTSSGSLQHTQTPGTFPL